MHVEGATFDDIIAGAEAYTITAVDDTATADTNEFDGTLIASTIDAADCNSTYPRSETVIRFRGCGVEGGDVATLGNNVSALHFSNIRLSGAQALGTAGSSVMLSARVLDTDGEVLETAPAVAIYNSKNTVEVTVTSTGRVGIDSTADPAFSRLVAGTGVLTDTDTEARIGTVTAKRNMTTVGSGGTQTAGALIGNSTIEVTHEVMQDDAFVKLTVGESLTAPDARNRNLAISGSTATFSEVANDAFLGAEAITDDTASPPVTTPAVASMAHDVMVEFNGRDAISSWPAGELSVTFVDAQAPSTSDNTSVPPGGSGELASFSRGGLNTRLNMAQSTYGDGATRYQSWVRISNTGVTDGPVTVTVHSSSTGEMLGSWDSQDIPAGGSIQVSAAALEDHLGHTPTGPDQYDLRIEGGINGYVQHVMWNALDGIFSDLSSFRAGGGLNTTP